MPIKYIPYNPDIIEGQAILDTITRSRRLLRYRDNDRIIERVGRGLPLYEVDIKEKVGSDSKNIVIRGECLAACAYLKDKNIKVDLVYIDPPFASGADYAKKVYIRQNPKITEKIEKAEEELEIDELKSFEEKLYGDIWNKEDYLNWMYENLRAIKSVMSDNGSIYVHLDWHIGHYVKILMDEIFGEDNFVNEIIWSYSTLGRPKDRFALKHDTIFWYGKSETPFFNEIETKIPYTQEYIKSHFRDFDDEGKICRKRFDAGKWRIYYPEEGMIPNDVWEISYENSMSKERVDYATQKPEALLTRIIKASSNEGMIVADFFGGSGVTAKVANDLNRNFIHCDIGINSIQITRDRLIESKASFSIYDIKDGVSLFRNPVQTMDKLKELIHGLIINEDGLDKKWFFGSIYDSKFGTIPIYVPDLKDHNQKVLDIPFMQRFINKALNDLPEFINKVIVYYINIEDKEKLDEFIKENNFTPIDIELKDLKIVLDEIVIEDIIDYNINDLKGEYEIEIKSFISDRLIQKIDIYNQKKMLTNNKKKNKNNIEDDNEKSISSEKNISSIKISEEGLELIEFISLDYTNSNRDDVWHSDFELKIDKNGYIILNGVKKKDFWDGKIITKKRPLRMKIRNIAGDESITIIKSK